MDGIDNRILKNLPKKAIVKLLYIINAILKLQHFPQLWKCAEVVPILKSGKNPERLDSYRPISLLSLKK